MIKFKQIFSLKKLAFLPVILPALLLLALTCFNFLNTRAASFDFNPSSTELLAGCRSSINIDANATNETSNAADIEIQYNSSQIDILDSDSNIPGTQIKTGNAYESYFGNDVNASLNRIRLAGASFVGNLTSKKTFATIEFQSKPNVISTSFQIKFTGVNATLDSNIADSSTSDDLLKSVTNGNYTFKTDFCQQDKEPPKIINQSPKAYDTGVAANSKITIQITDNQSGVDISKTKFYINNDEYLPNDSGIVRTGSALNYTFVITPKTPIPTDAASTVRVITQDIVANASNNQIIFNIPPSVAQQIICPAFLNPNGATGGTGNTIGSGLGLGGKSSLGNGSNVTVRTGGYLPEEIKQLKSNFEEEKSATSLLSTTQFNTSFLNEFISRPVLGNSSAIKALEASLKTFQYFSLFNLFILFLAILNIFLPDRKREIRGYALNSTKQVVAGVKVELFNLISLLKEGEYYSENDGEYIFKLNPGSYEVRFSDGGKNYREDIIMPEIKPAIFLGKVVSMEEDKYLQIVAQVWFAAKLSFVKLYPGILFIGILIALINLFILTTWLNILILAVYMAIIGTIWIPKLVLYAGQVSKVE